MPPIILENATNITVIPPPWLHQPQVDLNILLPFIAVVGFIFAAILTWFAVECGLIPGSAPALPGDPPTPVA